MIDAWSMASIEAIFAQPEAQAELLSAATASGAPRLNGFAAVTRRTPIPRGRTRPHAGCCADAAEGCPSQADAAGTSSRWRPMPA